ncbi:unnamed protein product [Cuscuta epithymum]|uniref:Uncharacterized protein n=1 Tax=Cuscuta epithymum TaxID=186058 RepID=A0AAV0ER39_9ASTE|nr:unnamed protein product [Cuscuta epithymum]
MSEVQKTILSCCFVILRPQKSKPHPAHRPCVPLTFRNSKAARNSRSMKNSAARTKLDRRNRNSNRCREDGRSSKESIAEKKTLAAEIHPKEMRSGYAVRIKAKSIQIRKPSGLHS